LLPYQLVLISNEEFLLSISVVVESGRKDKVIGARRNHPNFALPDIKFL